MILALNAQVSKRWLSRRTIPGVRRFSATVGRESRTSETYAVFNERQVTSPGNRSNPQPGDPAPTLSTEGSPARTLAWPASGPVLGESAATSGLSSSESCLNCGHDGVLLRMSPDFYPATADATSPTYSNPWANAGSMVSRGAFWTRKTSESRNAAAACSLSAVLQDQPSRRYFLSARAAAGILRRAKRRGKALPGRLEEALRQVSEATETT